MTTAAELISALDEFESEHGVRPRRIYLDPTDAARMAQEVGMPSPLQEPFTFMSTPVTLTSHPREQRILDCCEWEFHIDSDPLDCTYRLGVVGRVEGTVVVYGYVNVSDDVLHEPAMLLPVMDDLHRLLLRTVPAHVGVGPARPVINQVGAGSLAAGFQRAVNARAGRLRPVPSLRFDSTFSIRPLPNDAVIRVATGA
jgi:hypothetical protein